MLFSSHIQLPWESAGVDGMDGVGQESNLEGDRDKEHRGHVMEAPGI